VLTETGSTLARDGFESGDAAACARLWDARSDMRLVNRGLHLTSAGRQRPACCFDGTFQVTVSTAQGLVD
jgi:hypothetical protein